MLRSLRKLSPSRRTGQDSSCRSEVISDPMDAEEGLQMIKSLIVEPSILEDDKVLDMDECRAIFLEHGIDMDAADDLPDCSDEEFEEMLKEQDDEEAIPADLENGNMEVEKEPVEGDVVKKQGTRLLEIIITVESYFRFAFVLVYGLSRTVTRILCKVGLEKDGEQWIQWWAQTLLQYYPTCIYFCFRSQYLRKGEWDRVAIIMGRRLRLQWHFMENHRDKGRVACALQGLSLRGAAIWGRYKLRPIGLVIQQVWWWEIWWGIRIEIRQQILMVLDVERCGTGW
ncbi:hypothetical protein F2Q69_00061357 [Brassica cretica]|uniref:Uncharacterized protein n=1 Tax=Brassica cretica TaxID=69181 RepID=A0A8S9RNR0_BRACR|nr:hypothetical protein F2Q69_00061357 [Brassica cretica]